MKVRTVLALGLIASPAFAAEQVDRTLDADPDGTVTVSNVSGSVEVRGWDRSEVNVTGTLGDRVEELVFERDGDEIYIKVEVERRSSRGADAELVISVPQGSSLEVDTVSADIDVEGVQGDLELASVSGDIDTGFFGEDVELGTVSGDIVIRANGQEARAELTTVSGDIELENLSGELEMDAVNGDISAITGSYERVRLETVNGEITWHATLLNDGRMDIETINGRVDVEFAGDINATFDIETFNGSIRNCFGPESERTSRYAPGRELTFREGNGDGRVNIQTLNGSVRLCR